MPAILPAPLESPQTLPSQSEGDTTILASSATRPVPEGLGAAASASGTWPELGAYENDLAAGTLVAGCRIERRVAAGGMGVVYRAFDLRLGRRVAIKISLRSNDAEQTQLAMRSVLAEGRALGRIHNPGVSTAFRSGTLDPATAYLVLEWIDGKTLKQLLREAPGAWDMWAALPILIRLAIALQSVHDQGFVHRDVKPENVMQAASGQLKLIDFGLATPIGQQSNEPSNVFFATPAYAAPEAIRGLPVDERTDIYALGCMAFEMFAGRKPFSAKGSPVAVLHQHVHEARPSLASHDATIAPELSAFVARMMARNANDRPRSMAQVIETLAWLYREEYGKWPAAYREYRSHRATQ